VSRLAHPTRRRARRLIPLTARNGEVTLAGSLWLPDARPTATVLMHPGSGPSNRDNDIYFPPIRAHLLERGVAVCSFDKRGVGGSTGSWLEADIVEQAHDLAAALDALRAVADLDAPVGVFGHSQGGWVVLEAQRRLDSLEFVVTNSGPGVTPAVQERYSALCRMRRAGLTDIETDALLDYYDRMQALMADGAPFDDARARLDQLGVETDRDGVPMVYLAANAVEWEFEASIVDYEPRPALREVRVPLLALFGADDELVPVEPSVAVFREVVAADLLTVAVIPGGDHRIQAGDPLRPADGYLETLSSFIAGVL
jgi:pimeloyl-ACP methyl ester carboxylesterase